MSLAEAFTTEPSPVVEGLNDPYLLKAIFLGGAGGSGKSTVSVAMFGGVGLKIISADKHLERFLKLAKIPFSDVGTEYGLFAKAREVMQMELRHYAQRRLGLIIDSTAWDYNRVATPAKKLQRLGYDLFMVFVTTTLETAHDRNRARAERGGRFVPDSYVEDAWRGAHRNLKRYARLFGPKNMRIIENDVDVSVEDWVAVIKPQLRNIGQRILNRPLKNPIGKKWLKKQENPKTRTIEKPGKSEWPKPRSPKLPSLSKKKGKGLDASILGAMQRSVVDGPQYLRRSGKGFVLESEDTGASYYIVATPEIAVLHEREADGVPVPLRTFTLCGARLVVDRADFLLPIPLEEKHWRDNPKDFRSRLKIAPEKSDPGDDVASIGKSAKDGKWYGYSHRAYSGFGKGDPFFPRLTFHSDWPSEKQDAWEKEERAKQSKIKTDAEAQQSARNFAQWVS